MILFISTLAVIAIIFLHNLKKNNAKIYIKDNIIYIDSKDNIQKIQAQVLEEKQIIKEKEYQDNLLKDKIKNLHLINGRNYYNELLQKYNTLNIEVHELKTNLDKSNKLLKLGFTNSSDINKKELNRLEVIEKESKTLKENLEYFSNNDLFDYDIIPLNGLDIKHLNMIPHSLYDGDISIETCNRIEEFNKKYKGSKIGFYKSELYIILQDLLIKV